jgi:hypothetical protein
VLYTTMPTLCFLSRPYDALVAVAAIATILLVLEAGVLALTAFRARSTSSSPARQWGAVGIILGVAVAALCAAVLTGWLAPQNLQSARTWSVYVGHI